MPLQMSHAAQDYLKSLYLIASERGSRHVPTSAIARRMGVSAPSATNMLKRLDGMGLVAHLPYRGAALTAAGNKVALEVIRHHRLLETYLAQALGVPWDEVHDEAEVLEHVLSEELEERIAARLGHPETDPHGHPIPDKDLSMPSASTRRLWEVDDGADARVERVSDAVAEALRYLAEVAIRPGVRVHVVRRGPVGGPLFVRVERGVEVALSRELAEAVWVA